MALLGSPVLKGTTQDAAISHKIDELEKGYRSIRPRVDPPRVDPPHVRPKRGRSAPSFGSFRPNTHPLIRNKLFHIIRCRLVNIVYDIQILIDKGGATIVIGETMSLPILMSAGDRGVQNY